MTPEKVFSLLVSIQPFDEHADVRVSFDAEGDHWSVTSFTRQGPDDFLQGRALQDRIWAVMVSG